MKPDADAEYLKAALIELELCKTEAEVVTWDSIFCANEQYLHLPDEMVRELEEAYRNKVAHIYGWGAG